MRTQLLAIATGVALCSMLIAYRQVRTSSAPSEQSAAVRSLPAEGVDLHKLSSELAQLRRQVSALRGQVAAQRTAPDEEDVAQRSEAAAQPPEQSWQERMEEVTNAFEQEPLDPSWSARMSATLRQAFDEQEGLRAALRSVECRSHSCRVEVAADQDPSTQRSLTLLLHRLGQSFPRMRAEPPDAENGQRTVMYFES